MNCNDVKPGLRVKITQLGKTDGILVVKHHLDCRKVGVTGTVAGYVGGHGGDVWWVEHDGDEQPKVVGAYCYNEFEPIGFEKLTAVGLLNSIQNARAERKSIGIPVDDPWEFKAHEVDAIYENLNVSRNFMSALVKLFEEHVKEVDGKQ